MTKRPRGLISRPSLNMGLSGNRLVRGPDLGVAMPRGLGGCSLMLLIMIRYE